VLSDEMTQELLDSFPSRTQWRRVPALVVAGSSHIVVTALLAAVLGPITPARLMAAAISVNRKLANSRRRRKPAITYPHRTLF